MLFLLSLYISNKAFLAIRYEVNWSLEMRYCGVPLYLTTDIDLTLCNTRYSLLQPTISLTVSHLPFAILGTPSYYPSAHFI